MSNTLKLGTDGKWAVKKGSTLAYNDTNGNYKPLPFTFNRAGSATRVNKQGLIEVVPNNEPRIDFSNDSKGALKLEPLRSNLFTYSEDFTQGWSKSNVSISKNTQISPDGTQNADTFSVTSGFGYYYQAPSLSSGSTVTQSIFVKNIDADRIILLARKLTTSGSASFYFTNSEITSVDLTSGISADFEDYGNGWYRIYLTCQTDEDNEWFRFQLPESGNSCYIWGAQLEQGSYATSYIPTQGSIGTRVTESCSDAGNEQVFNDSEGVLFAEISALDEDAGTERYIYIGNGTTANRVVIRYSTTQNDIRMLVTSGGSTQVSSGTTNYNITENHKIALKYKANDFALWIDGVEVLTDTNGSTPTGINQLTLSYSGTQFYGNTKQLQYFDTALSDEELAALTTI